MTPRARSARSVLSSFVLNSTALLLALLPGCAPHRATGAAAPVGSPASIQTSSQTAQMPALPVAPPFRELNLNSLGQRVPVLTYHDVIASRKQLDAVWFDCTAAEFEAQMKFLHDQGAHVITLSQLQRHLTSGEPLPDKAIALTFDDSYQGMYDNAVPVLRRYGYPYAVFVHTDYVGSRKGRPKMTWDELRELDRNGLATIGSHSRSHPADMGLLTTVQQDEELQGSRRVLEQELGHPLRFLSYPNGKADTAVFDRARLAGYTLGFMEEWGPVEQSPGILALNRYIHIQLPRAWAETYGLDALPTSSVVRLGAPAPTTIERTVAAGVRLTLRRGGALSGQLTPVGKVRSSADFIASNGPAPAQNVWITSHTASGAPLGPYMAQDGVFVPEADPAKLALVLGRPLVAWNGERLAFLPFAPGLMNTDTQLRAFLPGLKGAFVAGAWLVQRGQALSSAGILSSGTSDLRTLRPRVFLGVTAAGEPLMGVSRGPVNARQLALAAVAAGAQDAALAY